MSKEKIGFFGGCFNPVTIAHIKLIKEAIVKCNLDKVYIIPMGDWYKKQELISSKHRYNMLCIAVDKIPNIDILDISIKSDIPTNAIETFKKIENIYNDSENYFIMGSDNYNKIDSWKDSTELKNNFKFIILDRGNTNSGEYQLISDDSTQLISSSLVREKIKNNEDISDYVLKDVENYIKENKLYK